VNTRIAAFTIAEVLAALSIVMMAAVVLGTAYINVLLGYERAKRSTQVDADVRFAREILFRIPALEAAEDGDDFATVDGRRIFWQAEIETTRVPDLFEVEFRVEVTEPDGGASEVITERFRLLRPTWSEDDESDLLRQEMRDDIEQYLRGVRGER